MALKYTADELIESVQNLCVLPGTSPTGTSDTDVLRHLNEAMKTRMIPEIISLRSDYFVITTRETVSSNRVRIPKRSIGNRIRDAYFYSGSTRKQLELIPREKLHYWTSSDSSSQPDGCFVEGNYLRFIPDKTYSGYAEIAFFFRPGDLVKEASARQITNLVGSDATVATVPATWSTGNTFDVHSQESGADIKVWDATASTVSGTTITFSSAIDGSTYGTTAVEIGDWICLSNEATIPAIPREAHPILVELACLQIAKANETDLDALQIRFAEARNYKESLKNLMFDRIEPKQLTITGANGILWQGKV